MTQKDIIFEALVEANGGWVSGQHFLRKLYLSQYHARIFELQRELKDKDIGEIEASDFTDSYGFKSYRLILNRQPALL